MCPGTEALKKASAAEVGSTTSVTSNAMGTAMNLRLSVELALRFAVHQHSMRPLVAAAPDRSTTCTCRIVASGSGAEGAGAGVRFVEALAASCDVGPELGSATTTGTFSSLVSAAIVFEGAVRLGVCATCHPHMPNPTSTAAAPAAIHFVLMINVPFPARAGRSPNSCVGAELGIESCAQQLEPPREPLARRDLVDVRAARDLGHRQLVEVAVQDRRAVRLGERHHRARDALLPRAALDDLGLAPVSLGPGDRSFARAPRRIRARAIERESRVTAPSHARSPLARHGVVALERDARDLLRHVVGCARVAHDREREPAHPAQVGQELFASGSRRDPPSMTAPGWRRGRAA